MAQPEYPERDGFQLTNKTFTNLSNAADQVTKRQTTICNLFVNHQLPITDIVRVLDETPEHVVSVLIEQGYIHERRKHPRKPIEVEGNRSVCRMIC
jgi:hypothetical protein